MYHVSAQGVDAPHDKYTLLLLYLHVLLSVGDFYCHANICQNTPVTPYFCVIRYPNCNRISIHFHLSLSNCCLFIYFVCLFVGGFKKGFTPKIPPFFSSLFPLSLSFSFLFFFFLFFFVL